MENLSNIIWRALSGSHRRLSVGTERTRRYSREFSALLAFEDPPSADLASFGVHCEPGDHLYCTEWKGDAPAGWTIDVDTSVVAMMWRGDRPVLDHSIEVSALDESHVEDMHALVQLTLPGPFARKPMGMGDWLGVFDAGRLVAMAGERLQAGSLHEVSGICTHPDAQGRGLARALTLAMVRRQLDRGETPFLHVMPGNARARTLYERIGFEVDREVPLRVVTRI
jgi:ribosomal protein S18 acetylase RimI-like enzyme